MPASAKNLGVRCGTLPSRRRRSPRLRSLQPRLCPTCLLRRVVGLVAAKVVAKLAKVVAKLAREVAKLAKVVARAGEKVVSLARGMRRLWLLFRG